jgi:hypothetical protein
VATSQNSSGKETPEQAELDKVNGQFIGYAEPASEGEEDEDLDKVAAHDEDKRTGLTGHEHEVREAIAWRQKMLREQPSSSKTSSKAKAKSRDFATGQSDAEDEASGDERTPFLKSRRAKEAKAEEKKRRVMSIDPLAPSTAFDETLRERLQKETRAQEEQEQPQPQNVDDRILERNWRAPPGKHIAVPVRVEPKVYFALERTFLKWLNFAVLIGTIATTLLNFVPADDEKGLISAGLFTFAALVSIAYSAIIFVYRSRQLRDRKAEGLYYDKYGPTVLCVVLFAALATNTAMRVKDMISA